MLHLFHAHIDVLQGKQHEYLKLFPSSLFMACMHIYIFICHRTFLTGWLSSHLDHLRAGRFCSRLDSAPVPCQNNGEVVIVAYQQSCIIFPVETDDQVVAIIYVDQDCEVAKVSWSEVAQTTYYLINRSPSVWFNFEVSKKSWRIERFSFEGF